MRWPIGSRRTHEVFVVEENGTVVGTYFLRPNQHGGGAHVCNCGYVTGPNATGRGIARAMCAHSLDRAKERGFLAMQFNFVISTNERAVRLWESFGFKTVGRLPRAFRHPTQGLVDSLVMHRFL
jgi:RimJ/RimL family protein N-acetyltransferase